MKKITYYTLFIFISLLASCNKRDHVNIIPANSTALVAMNAMDFVGEKSPFASILAPFVDSEEKQLKGIDLTKDVYLFEAGDGSFGLSASMADSYDFDDFMKRLRNLGGVGEFIESDGITFCVVKNTWVVGFDDDVLLMMGPVTGVEAEKQMIKRMGRLMNQDKENNITTKTIWKHLNEIQAPIRFIAQASALPDQMVAALTLGTPKGTTPSDVLLEAGMEYNDKTLYLDGATCSYNENVKQALKKSFEVYKPITITWEKEMKDSTLVGVFMNVDGENFMPYIQANKALNTLLLGTEAYDRIRENHGNLAILVSPSGELSADGNFNAKVRNLPKGTTKTDNRLIVVLNLEAITGKMGDGIPFLSKIKRVIYRVK